MDLNRLFVYGTLREARVQDSVIGRRVVGRPARLYGYTKDSIRQGLSVYPILAAADPRQFVDGEVLDLTTQELERTDEYEGAPYRRLRVTVDSGDACWVYMQ